MGFYLLVFMKYIIAVLCFSIISCRTKWDAKNRAELMGGCINTAMKEMPADKARKYCQCMQEKIEAKYPNASDAHYLKFDTSLKGMGRACLKQVSP